MKGSCDVLNAAILSRLGYDGVSTALVRNIASHLLSDRRNALSESWLPNETVPIEYQMGSSCKCKL
jgi:hypothetical protein